MRYILVKFQRSLTCTQNILKNFLLDIKFNRKNFICSPKNIKSYTAKFKCKISYKCYENAEKCKFKHQGKKF